MKDKIFNSLKQNYSHLGLGDAIRMTGTETNMAYRTSDHERWNMLDFVVGVEVRLSDNHTLNGRPFTDICDYLAGKYPKDFKFIGWHPQCRCYAIPILKTTDEMFSDAPSENEVKDMPENFKKWVEDNAEKIQAAEERGKLPYFLKDNEGYYLSARKAIFTKKKYSEEFIAYANKVEREDIHKWGLAHAPEMFYEAADKVSMNDLSLLMETYYDQDPFKLRINGGFGGINVTESRTHSAQCVRDERHRNYFEISKHTFDIGGIKFNAHNELLNAIQMIRDGKTLTFKEEYAIEGLWHEMMHANSTWDGYFKRLSLTQTTAMEAIHQFVARRTYSGFLSQLGGKAMHQDAIIKSGAAYANEIRNLMRVFDKYDIKTDGAFKFFEKKILTDEGKSIEGTLIKFLSDKKVKKAKECVQNLSFHRSKYAMFLNDL